MAKSVTLLSTNPRTKRNPSRRRRNPDIAIPVVGKAVFPDTKQILGGLGGGVVATMMPKFANVLLSRFGAAGGGMIQQLLLVAVSWTGNALIGGVLKKQGQASIGDAYILGSSAVHAMQALSVFSGGKMGLTPSVAGPRGRSVGALPAPSQPMVLPNMPQPAAGSLQSAVSGTRPPRISGTVDIPSGATPGGRRHINIT